MAARNAAALACLAPLRKSAAGFKQNIRGVDWSGRVSWRGLERRRSSGLAAARAPGPAPLGSLREDRGQVRREKRPEARRAHCGDIGLHLDEAIGDLVDGFPQRGQGQIDAPVGGFERGAQFGDVAGDAWREAARSARRDGFAQFGARSKIGRPASLGRGDGLARGSAGFLKLFEQSGDRGYRACSGKLTLIRAVEARCDLADLPP